MALLKHLHSCVQNGLLYFMNQLPVAMKLWLGREQGIKDDESYKKQECPLKRKYINTNMEIIITMKHENEINWENYRKKHEYLANI